MKLPHAKTTLANIMLNEDLMPDRFIGQPTPEELVRRVCEYATGVIETLEVGQSLLIELTDDQMTPWKLTWKDAPK